MNNTIIYFCLLCVTIFVAFIYLPSNLTSKRQPSQMTERLESLKRLVYLDSCFNKKIKCPEYKSIYKETLKAINTYIKTSNYKEIDNSTILEVLSNFATYDNKQIIFTIFNEIKNYPNSTKKLEFLLKIAGSNKKTNIDKNLLKKINSFNKFTISNTLNNILADKKMKTYQTKFKVNWQKLNLTNNAK